MEPETQESFDSEFNHATRSIVELTSVAHSHLEELQREAADFVRELFLKHGYFNGRIEFFLETRDSTTLCKAVVSCYGLPRRLAPEERMSSDDISKKVFACLDDWTQAQREP